MAGSRVAVCSWSLRPESPDDLLSALRRLEIDAVQLALGPLADDPAVWGSAGDVLRAGGVRIVSGMLAFAGEDYSSLDTIARTGGVRPDATWTSNRAHAEAVASVASDLGLGLVTFHAGFMPERADDPERDTILGRVRDVADLFAARAIRLGFETGQETAETLASFLDVLDRPNAGVNFDPANMILYGKGDPCASLDRLAPHVMQLHVKDAVPAEVPGTWGREMPAGKGAVDWRGIFETALRIEPPIDFVIEREAGETREVDIRAGRALVLEHLSAAAAEGARGAGAQP